jgi:hypothetical protein
VAEGADGGLELLMLGDLEVVNQLTTALATPLRSILMEEGIVFALV